jgi:hypothetical protein
VESVSKLLDEEIRELESRGFDGLSTHDNALTSIEPKSQSDGMRTMAPRSNSALTLLRLEASMPAQPRGNRNHNGWAFPDEKSPT